MRNSERSLNADNLDASNVSASHMRTRTNSRGSLPRQGSLTFMGLSVARPTRYRQSSGAGRSSARRLGSSSTNLEYGDARPQNFKAKAAYRRYRVGDNVLICCNSHWVTLVNRHGFPPGEGLSMEEQSGPYAFVLASVKTVHFDEFAEYYTVKRADTGTEQRADTGTYSAFN